MLKSYFKSIYNTITDHNITKSSLINILNKNDDLIFLLNNTKKSRELQNGGKIYRTITIPSLHNNNLYLSNKTYQLGGNCDFTEFNQILDRMSKYPEEFRADIDQIKKNTSGATEWMNIVAATINYLAKKTPDDKKLTTITQQLDNINKIISEY